MTTETTSPSLHERMMKISTPFAFSPQKWSYGQVRDADLAAIERDLIAEATAPLRQEIEAGHTNLDWTIKNMGDKIAELRAENAALRQAGDALRIAVERLLSAHGDVAISGETSRLFSAAVRYDAATTPRAEETPMPSQNVIDWLKSDVERLTLRVKLADRMATEYGNASENNPNTEAIVSAWSDYYELMVKELMPDTSPTDAAGEGEPAPWETYWIDTSKRLAALEQRADNGRERVERISKAADENTHNLVEALEARSPVAVTPEMWESGWAAFIDARNEGLPLVDTFRAGLTAALAAAAKGAGK